jgi:hypothetical protein
MTLRERNQDHSHEFLVIQFLCVSCHQEGSPVIRARDTEEGHDEEGTIPRMIRVCTWNVLWFYVDKEGSTLNRNITIQHVTITLTCERRKFMDCEGWCFCWIFYRFC